jgi:diaminopimelate decarboxylase
MNLFDYRDDRLYGEGVSLEEIADRVGTPCYVYSRGTLERHFRAFTSAFASLPVIICPAVKALSNLSVLELFGRWGGGADVVSGGELFRAEKAGIPACRIVYAGVGKTQDEIVAALKAGILMFNIESVEEMAAIDRIARGLGVRAPIALRINPDVDPHTHAHITTGKKGTKFGLEIPAALEGYRAAREMEGLQVVGIHTHIGSQITEVEPFVEAATRVVGFAKELLREGLPIRYVDLGGGLGIPYRDEVPPLPSDLADRLRPILADGPFTYILEPGRVLVGNAGVLLTKVLYKKEGDRSFVIVDAGMNDLVRPSFYGSYHGIRPVHRRPGGRTLVVDVVGPICESSDYLAKDRELPEAVPGEYLAVMSAGAYGFTMASNYNSRPRAAEVLIEGNRYRLVRRRESYDDLIRGEELPPAPEPEC